MHQCFCGCDLTKPSSTRDLEGAEDDSHLESGHGQQQLRRQVGRSLNLVPDFHAKIQQHIVHAKLLEAVQFLFVSEEEFKPEKGSDGSDESDE